MDLTKLSVAPDQQTGADLTRQVVVRNDLVDRVLQHGASLVLFIAPAGFGKTIVMAQLRDLLQSQGARTAWWSLDRSDNDPQRLFEFLRQVLHPQGNAQASTPVGIFLDDFEVVEGGPLPEIVKNLLGQLPAGSRLVIGSRRKIGIGLAQLRAQGAVLDFNATDLQFSKAQSAQIFRKSMGTRPLSTSTLDILLEKTAGWPAAVTLASIALAHPAENDGVLATQLAASMQPVEEYLSEVVLDHQPPEVYEFLLSTSVLHQLEPSLCQELVPSINCEYLLERLISSNLFVSPVPSQVELWRYHPVFVDILRKRLLKKRPNDYIRMHLAASGWYENNSRVVPAIDHALAGGDYPHACKLLSSNASRLLMDGRLKLLSRWFAVLPLGILKQYPQLFATKLWVTTFTLGAAEASQQLESISDFWPGTDEKAIVHFDALRCSWLFMQDKLLEAGEIGKGVIARIPTSEPYADNVVSVSMSIFLVQDGMRDAAHRLLSDARKRQGDSAFMRMFIESAESEQDLQDGLLKQATARLRIAVGATAQAALGTLDMSHGNAWAGVLYAVACYEAGDMNQAKRLLRAYAPVIQAMGSHDHLTLAMVCLSRIARSQGAADEGAGFLAELEHAGMTRNLPRLVASAWLERARDLIFAGHAQAASEALARADLPEVWNQDRNLRRLAHSALDLRMCRLHWTLAFGDAKKALSEIDVELNQTRSFRWQLRALSLELMRAAALSRHGQETAALDQLQSTLQWTFEQGMVRRVIDEGPMVIDLVAKLVKREKNRSGDNNFLKYLLQLHDPLPSISSSVDQSMQLQKSNEQLLSPLTQKELQVLELLAEGYSNFALSDELGVSKSTVRTHLRNINSKMDVNSRMQAVAKARQLGLLK